MNSKKAIIILIAASVLVAAVAGIAFAQYVGVQNNGLNNPNQTQSPSYPYPQQSYNPYGSAQNGYPLDYGRGMGMCGRNW